MGLDREQVVKAAINLMNEVGLDGLSLRRLAKDLGVQAPALYWHFKNKQELLDQMAEYHWQHEVPPARRLKAGEDWPEWLCERARNSRAALLNLRDGAKLAASTKPSRSMFGDIELQMDVLCGAGFTAGEALRGMFVLSNYVAGFVLEEQADLVRGDNHVNPPGPEVIEAFAKQMAGFPRVAEGIRQIGDPQGANMFEFGLKVIVDGMRAQLSPRESGPARRS